MPEKPPAPNTDSPDSSLESARIAAVNSWEISSDEHKQPANVKGDFELAYAFTWDGLDTFEGLSLNDDELPVIASEEAPDPSPDPLLIAAWGLHNLILFLHEGDIRARFTAIRMAEWLATNMVVWQNSFYAWPTDTTEPFFDLPGKRLTAEAHGLGLSLLLRVAYLENDGRFDEAAARIVRIFFLPAENGGLAGRFPDGSLAFENYATKPPSLDLIGFLFAVHALHDYSTYFDDHAIRSLYFSSRSSLKANLEQYDTGFWILRDLHPSRRLATPQQISIISRLLHGLGHLTEDEYFSEIADHWQAYPEQKKSRFSYRWHRLLEKIRFRFFRKKYHLPARK